VEGSGKVAQTVKATPGAIGYISSDYVQRDHLIAVSLRNKRGEWIAPSIEGFSAASRAGGLFKTSLEAAPLLDIDGAGVWPIVTATYILVPRSPASVERAGRTLNFFYRSFLLGDKAVAGTGFAPLPILTQARIVGLLTSFRAVDGRPVPVLGESSRGQAVALRSE
jgi:phosphate transport system substrate-binding protein